MIRNKQIVFVNQSSGYLMIDIVNEFKNVYGERLPDLRAAFDIDSLEDTVYLKEVFATRMDAFEQLFGYRSTFFIPTNGPFNNSMESFLSDQGIKYIGTAKMQIEPLGNNKYKKHFKYIGKKNIHEQTYLTRNSFFEPNNWEYSSDKDWVASCLKEIEIAFRFRKPATISSHRVNYMGTLHPENRDNGLKMLDKLLTQIINRWPDVEFMTAIELGDLITGAVPTDND